MTTPTPPRQADATRREPSQAGRTKRESRPYPYWFLLPGGLVFTVLFLVPSFIAFYFSLTRWTLFDRSSSGWTTSGSSSPSRRWSRASPTRSSTPS